MMVRLAIFGLVGLAASSALVNWRRGPYWLILIGLFQDPLRKLHPGAPAYLVLMPAPVWVAMMLNAVACGDLSWIRLRTDYPRLSFAASLMALAFTIPVFRSATYGPGSWQLTLLGAYTYVSVFAAILLGAYFPRRPGQIERLLFWYCALAAPLMLGAVLERAGWGERTLLVGTRVFGATWQTARTGRMLAMVSGFFRSPDVLGWHAATLAMFGVTLALGPARWHRPVWIACAGWAGVALMFCARRKMIAMLPVFAVALVAMEAGLRHVRRLLPLAGGLALAALVGLYAYYRVGPEAEVEKFYATTSGELGERVQAHAYYDVIGTVRQAGFFGHGLGMALQGTHHIRAARPRIWQESGPTVLMADVGIPGFVAFIVFGLGLLVTGLEALRRVAAWPPAATYFGLASVVLANGGSALVSSQIFGDPFIGIFLPFMTGLVLSAHRIEADDGATDLSGTVTERERSSSVA